MTFWETVERGEYVMIALAVLLIAVVVFWIAKGIRLKREKKSYDSLMPMVRDNVVEGDIETACQICESVRTPGAVVVFAGLNKLGHPISEVEKAMHKVAKSKIKDIRTGMDWLRLIAVISPLIGLGGTLVGVIDRLRDLGETDMPVDISILCASIAPTIVTTVAGIVTGIIALIALTALNVQINSTVKDIDNLSNEFIELLNEPS